MRWLLNLAYLTLLTVVSPLLFYRALRYKKYREGWAQRFLGQVHELMGDTNPEHARKSGVRRLWFHAVSLGEVHVLAPLLEEILRRHPEWECVVSTTTKTGFEAAARKFPNLVRFYCPLDFSWAVDEAMRRVAPDVLVLSELEVWPNLISAAKRSGAAVAIVNGRLSEKSFRGYRRLRWLLKATLARVDRVAAQSATYADRFERLGVSRSRLTVTGSIKFDGAVTERDNPRTRRLAALAQVPESAVVLLAGSTQAPEEQLAVDAFRSLEVEFPELWLLVAPRHPERFEEAARVIERNQIAFRRRSELLESPLQALPDDCGEPQERVLLLDSLGELQAWWGLSDIAYVGGSMGKRQGQNMIEPAAYGAAVSFGPKTRNFRDVVSLLLEKDAAVVVQDGRELTEFVRDCLRDGAYRARLGERAQRVVCEQLGASRRTVDCLETLLARPVVRSQAA